MSTTIRAAHDVVTIGKVGVDIHTMRASTGEGRVAVEFNTGAGGLRSGFHGSNEEWRAFATTLLDQLDEADRDLAGEIEA